MKLLRMLVGSLLCILSGVVGLVGVLLTVTLILAPAGIPLLMLARRLFRFSMALFVPREARHPLETLKSSVQDAAPDVDVKRGRKKAQKLVKKRRKKLPV